MEVTACKTTKSEAKKLCNELIQKDIDALEREKTDAPKREKIDGSRKYSILNILKNVGSIFTGLYFHCKDVPKETRFERNIA